MGGQAKNKKKNKPKRRDNRQNRGQMFNVFLFFFLYGFGMDPEQQVVKSRLKCVSAIWDQMKQEEICMCHYILSRQMEDLLICHLRKGWK